MDNEKEKSIAAQREEKILEFWQESNAFQKTLEKDSPKGEFVFYEGPPTANGKPGIHHLEARAFKDAIPRYKTMQGFHVRRKGGWDTHGLPVELQVEKKLGLNSKKAIEEYGVAKFNKECKESVWEYLDIWNKFTKRIGYWVDEDHPYVTYHNDYIESVWNVLKSVDDKKLLYKDYKVLPWCARCGTALSSHELAQGYQDDKDLSVTAKFKVIGQDNTYILAWTTTPWTLPGNVALAVGKDIEYVKVKVGNEFLIVAKERLATIFSEPQDVAEDFKGKDLVGLEYEPLFSELKTHMQNSEIRKEEFSNWKNGWKVYAADFVNTEDGTGIVHTAVMYGQDDFELGTKENLPKLHTVNESGYFITDVSPDFLSQEGRFVKDEDVAVDIIKDLAHRGLLFKKEKYEHSYPHCWRCKTPLIYYARDSWYIRMSDEKIKTQLINENKTINWEPSYIRDGRFGEWLKDIKDWAISRERYWGTPLPIWQNKNGGFEVIGSLDELKKKTKKSGNTYFLMRHGQTDNNLKNLVSTVINSGSHLTDEGKKENAKQAERLIKEKIDLIITSPFNRTKETAEIVKNVLGLSDEQVIIDNRLHEMSIPMYEGKTWDEYHNDYPKTVENFHKAPEGNESYADVKRRTMDFLFDIEEKYQNKKILIITHGGPAWLMVAGAGMLDDNATLDIILHKKDFHYLNNSEILELPFTPFPHDENYELDFHKPYIDEVKLISDDGEELIRTKEVMDVWFDSGSMPFAQDHYPFENKEWIDTKGFPADFISEAIDQTRGWFYTLHAIGILTGRGKAYKNVICLGHILDDKGKKMSKSLGNIVDPWQMMDKYGVDTLRLWMYSVNQPGESKNFDEKTVSELNNKVFNLLYNVLAFYELYRDPKLEILEYKKSENILDQWIIARLNQIVESMTNNLDNYRLLEPVRELRDFIDDLSTWYVRRSRERLKDNDADAKQTLYFVLKTLSKIMAPFAPFASEDIWQKLKNKDDVESVHLSEWPTINNADNVDISVSLLIEMKALRELVTLSLEQRQKSGIKVRQPLKSVTLKNHFSSDEFIEILKDELNIKEVLYSDDQSGVVTLDTHITEELRSEGQYRELVRAIQDMRKKAGLNPNDTVSLTVETNVEGQEFLNKWQKDLLKTVGAKEIKIAENSGTEIKIDELSFKISF
ncbi:MAG: class I tRNA ligase family protein [Patescibacteria group bacterium]|nr:class I tRNA ligase family protein [Patescibacteria group bacterium]